MPFPPDFVWGAATSAFQIEGGWDADGKGPSNWDAYCHAPGNVYGGHTGDVATDHYHRHQGDVALMKAMNLQAYRFSISWPRVMPEGTGAVNAKGLDFYSRLVDDLLGAGIRPWITLFHWDMPLSVYHRGGWLNREIADWFAEYTRVVVDRLSDRVGHWITINEPQIFLGPSAHEGPQATNSTKSDAERLLAAHHALLCHGRCAATIRARAKTPPRIGWAPIGRVKVPATDSPADIEAARRGTLGVLAKDFWNNTWFADPVVLGHYPEDGLRLYGPDAPRAKPGDMETIRQPLDFYGINVYDAERYRAAPAGAAAGGGGVEPGLERVDFPPGTGRNALGWFVCPEALYWGPKFLHERYKLPIVVTENGMSSHDWVHVDGVVRDFARIDYTRRYLQQFRRAAEDGVALGGYFHWSLLDNFEWQHGYKERFGLIHVDYQTLKRTPKESSKWYAKVIASGGAALERDPLAVLAGG